MSTRIVVLGGGDSGTLAANRLHRLCDGSDTWITVVEHRGPRDAEARLLTELGVYGPGTLGAPENLRLGEGIELRDAEAAAVDCHRREVRLTDGSTIGYGVLVVATGARVRRGRGLWRRARARDRGLPALSRGRGRPGVPGAAGVPRSRSRRGAPYVRRSPGLGDAHGLVVVDPGTRQSPSHPDVFAVGSAAADVQRRGPSVHVQAENLARSVSRLLAARALVHHLAAQRDDSGVQPAPTAVHGVADAWLRRL